MPQTYTQYRDEILALIGEMEAATPSNPDDGVVFTYRQRIALLYALRARENAFTADNCPVCGLTIYDCYAGGVHSFACDRLRDDSLICIEGCDDDDCPICSIID
jgi:hypothetical protein